MRTTTLFFTVAIIGALASSVRAEYIIQGIGTLGGSYSRATDINDSGQVTGYSSTSAGKVHAFIYDNGVMQDLGGLGNDSSRGAAINNAGQVTGHYTTSAGHSHAFLYDSGVMHDLGTLGGDYSGGLAINNAGHVLGTSTISTDMFSDSHNFLYDGGGMHDLGTSGARDFNDSGQILYALNSSYRIVDGGGTHPIPLGGDFLYAHDARAINNLGQVAGAGFVSDGDWIDGSPHAFLYDGVEMHALPTTEVMNPWDMIYATDINDLGQVIGYEMAAYNNPFLYDNGVTVNLNDLLLPGSGWVLEYAFAINNLGQIIGEGRYNGQSQSFLLSPVAPEPENVPEPISLAVWGGVGLAGLALSARRRKCSRLAA